MNSEKLHRLLEQEVEPSTLLSELVLLISKESNSKKVKNAAKKKHVQLLGKDSEYFAKQNGQFYTKRSIAEVCISNLDFSGVDLLVEPSAGRGDFLELFPSNIAREALDIDPKHPDVVEKDFLEFTPSKTGKVMVVGNPPFGLSANLAVSFFKHSSTFADTIAFILPRTFRKASIQNRLPLNFHLVKEVQLPENSFYVEGESGIEDFELRGVFQVWEKKTTLRKKIQEDNSHPDFDFVNKKDSHDFSVRRAGGRAGEITEDTKDVVVQGNYFIKQNNEKVIDIFQKIWDNELDPKVDKEKVGVKYDSAGQPSISKPEIISLYKKWKNS
jgi:hypothetical protein